MELETYRKDRYNAVVLNRPQYLPDANRLSVLSAMILLAYALARFIDLPARDFSLQLPGLFLEIEINVRTMVALLVAGLTATGASWLLHDHPAIGKKWTVEHWLLPALTAWVIGFPLFQLPLGLRWWAGFGFGGVLLMLVLVAEYIVVDPEDVRQPPASAGLTALSFAMFLALAAVLHITNLRLFLLLPALFFSAFLVTLRTLHLRLRGRWLFIQAGVVALLITEMAAGLHYWPISSVAFSLALLGPAYAITSLIGSLEEDLPISQAIVEPLVVLVLVWAVAFWIRS